MQEQHPDKHREILLVEDQAIIALSRKMMLEKKGFLVHHALSGEEAIRIIGEAPNIDLVLMDIDLGAGMDGTQTAEKILEIKNVPILFLTSHSEEEMVRRVRGITRYGYVLKSSGDFVLLAAIEMAFELFNAHQESQSQKERLQAIFTALPDLVFIIDRKGKYHDVIPGTAHLLYRTSEELLKGSISDYFPPEIVKQFLRGIEEALDTKKVVNLDYQLEIGKRPVWFQAAISPLQEDRVVWVARDISRQKAVEEGNRQLLEEQKLLLQEVHHRIKNDMTVISSILQLQSDITRNEEARKILKETSSRIHGMMELYHCLTISEKHLTLKAADYVSSIIREVEENFTTPGSIRFNVDVEDIPLDGKLLFSLGMILNELLVNAVRHGFGLTSRPTSTLTFTAREPKVSRETREPREPTDPQEPVISVRMRKLAGDLILLSVQDNGIGMAEANEGFGLSMIRKLSQQIQAEQTIQTGKGEGTLFQFRIHLS